MSKDFLGKILHIHLLKFTKKNILFNFIYLFLY